MNLTHQYSYISTKQSHAASVRKPTQPTGVRWLWVIRGFLSLLVMWVVVAFLMGCSLGIAKSQHMTQGLPQNFPLQASAEQVWRVITEEANSHDGCLLAKAPEDRLISWCEEVENWRDLGQDTVGPASLAGGVSPDAFAKFAQATGKGAAVTTIWVEEMDTGCVLHVRRVYYGSQSFAGVGHSRGEYERELHERILARLNGPKEIVRFLSLCFLYTI